MLQLYNLTNHFHEINGSSITLILIATFSICSFVLVSWSNPGCLRLTNASFRNDLNNKNDRNSKQSEKSENNSSFFSIEFKDEVIYLF